MIWRKLCALVCALVVSLSLAHPAGASVMLAGGNFQALSGARVVPVDGEVLIDSESRVGPLMDGRVSVSSGSNATNGFSEATATTLMHADVSTAGGGLDGAFFGQAGAQARIGRDGDIGNSTGLARLIVAFELEQALEFRVDWVTLAAGVGEVSRQVFVTFSQSGALEPIVDSRRDGAAGSLAGVLDAGRYQLFFFAVSVTNTTEEGSARLQSVSTGFDVSLSIVPTPSVFALVCMSIGVAGVPRRRR